MCAIFPEWVRVSTESLCLPRVSSYTRDYHGSTLGCCVTLLYFIYRLIFKRTKDHQDTSISCRVKWPLLRLTNDKWSVIVGQTLIITCCRGRCLVSRCDPRARGDSWPRRTPLAPRPACSRASTAPPTGWSSWSGSSDSEIGDSGHLTRINISNEIACQNMDSSFRKKLHLARQLGTLTGW